MTAVRKKEEKEEEKKEDERRKGGGVGEAKQTTPTKPNNHSQIPAALSPQSSPQLKTNRSYPQSTTVEVKRKQLLNQIKKKIGILRNKGVNTT